MTTENEAIRIARFESYREVAAEYGGEIDPELIRPGITTITYSRTHQAERVEATIELRPGYAYATRAAALQGFEELKAFVEEALGLRRNTQ